MTSSGEILKLEDSSKCIDPYESCATGSGITACIVSKFCNQKYTYNNIVDQYFSCNVGIRRPPARVNFILKDAQCIQGSEDNCGEGNTCAKLDDFYSCVKEDMCNKKITVVNEEIEYICAGATPS